MFNYGIRFEKYDKNPVSVVPQEEEPPGRDRRPEPEEIVEMIRVWDEKGDLELKAFLIFAPTTGMRKGEILSRRWSDIDLDSGNPCIYVRQTKNNEPKRIQLPDMAVEALRARPSYGRHEFVFPASPIRGSREISKGRTPGIWASASDASRSLLASRPFASTISAISQPRL